MIIGTFARLINFLTSKVFLSVEIRNVFFFEKKNVSVTQAFSNFTFLSPVLDFIFAHLLSVFYLKMIIFVITFWGS